MNDELVPPEFSAYFDLPDDTKKQAISKGVIVFDTSTLLSLYRIAPKQRKEILLELKNRLKERVWLPHQVFLEFSRHVREEKLKDAQRLNKTQLAIEQKIADLKNEVSIQKLDELDPDFSVENFHKKISSIQSSILQSINKVKTEYPDLSKSDEILSTILSLTQGRIIPGFNDQEQIDNASKAGALRYAQETPPGYLDQKKDGNLFHRGLQIPRKYGDWFIWHQLLEQIRKSPAIFEAVVFVTQDQKSDWWISNPEKSGEISGPRFELRQEIEAAGAKTYWQYTFQNFYKHLVSTDHEITPDQSAQLIEISNAERRVQTDLANRPEETEDWSYLLDSAKSQNWNKAYSAYYSNLNDVSNASNAAFNAASILKNWLRTSATPNRVVENDGFPDFLVKFNQKPIHAKDQWICGVEVLYPQTPEHAVQLVRVGLARNISSPFRLAGRVRKIYFLIVLNEFSVHGSNQIEWEECLIDIQGMLIDNSKAGVSIGLLKGGKFDSLDQIFGLEEPYLQSYLCAPISAS